MTTSELAQWLVDLTAARTYYEERFGWPVNISITERQVTIALGGTLDAITMAAPLATRVQAQLGIAMLAGPVIANPDDTDWTFLIPTAPPGVITGLVADLPGVRHTGTHTAVPAPGTNSRWIREPGPKLVLPSVHAVVATARRVLATQQGV